MAYTYDRRFAWTIELPKSFPKTEFGLMTKEEFLQALNPGSKHHPSESYDFDVVKMNQEFARDLGTVGHSSELFRVHQYSGGYLVSHDGEPVAVIHNGVAYYDSPRMKRKIPTVVPDRNTTTELGIKSYKQVKYLSEVMPLISPQAKRNRERYSVVLQHILVGGEPMTVRAEKAPQKDKGTELAILNSEGLQVAGASNEWGATLITVAREYRGKGLGKIIAKHWFEHNPSWESGGFTSAGQAMSLDMWRDRVRDFAARGWYTELVRQGRLSYERVKEILAGVGQRPPPKRELIDEKVKATGEILVYVDGSTTFVIYDRAFLEDQDEKFIHGFGFFRDADVGVFLYRIEYDRPFSDLTTKVALQIARDHGNKLYDGEGYHDMVEVDNIPGVVREGDFIVVTRDLLPVKSIAMKERRLRKAVDPYGEKLDLLLEMAEAKW